MAVTFQGVQYVDAVKVDHHTSTSTTWDILDLVSLMSSLGRGGKLRYEVMPQDLRFLKTTFC